MRALAEQLIREAAVAAGVPEGNVGLKDTSVKEILKPRPRVEIEFLTEKVGRKHRKLAKKPTEGQEGSSRTIITQTHERSLSVRAELVWEGDEAALETALGAFLLALPRKVADSQGNLVVIAPSRAERSGYEARMVEVIARRSVALHITFTGRITAETSVSLITDVNLVDGVDYKEAGSGQEAE